MANHAKKKFIKKKNWNLIIIKIIKNNLKILFFLIFELIFVISE
jgi:hypothetical protein